MIRNWIMLLGMAITLFAGSVHAASYYDVGGQHDWEESTSWTGGSYWPGYSTDDDAIINEYTSDYECSTTFTIHELSLEQGTLTATDGTMTVTWGFDVGTSTSTATYNLNPGATLTVSNGLEVHENGLVDQTGGTANFTTYYSEPLAGSYELSGNAASVTVNVPDLYIGPGSAETAFDQSGGTVNAGHVELAGNSQSERVYSMDGAGVLSISGNLYVGTDGQARLSQSAGTVRVGDPDGTQSTSDNGDLWIGKVVAHAGNYSGGDGIYELSGGALVCYGGLYLGDRGGPHGYEYSATGNLILHTGADLDVKGTLMFRPGAFFTVSDSSAMIKLSGPTSAMTIPGGSYPSNTSLAGLAKVSLVYNDDSSGTQKTITAAGYNHGASLPDEEDFSSGTTYVNYTIGELVVGKTGAAAPVKLQLVAQSTGSYAVYVKRLRIDPGGTFDLNGQDLYYLRAHDDETEDDVRRLIMGDADLDGDVDWDDYDDLAAHWGNTDAVWAEGDFDGDQDVDQDDLDILRANPESCLGDFTGDGVVDTADYTTWADNFGGDDTVVFAEGSCNADGEVDTADYTTWADNFGNGSTLSSGMMMLLLSTGPELEYTTTNLGDGLTGYTFTIANDDEEELSYATTICFEGVSSAYIRNVKFGTPGSHANDQPTAEFFAGFGFDDDRDSWSCTPFTATNSLPGDSVRWGDEFSGYRPDTENAAWWEFSVGTGASSEYGDDTPLAYIVSDGDVSWSGTIARDGETYSVSGSTAE